MENHFTVLPRSLVRSVSPADSAENRSFRTILARLIQKASEQLLLQEPNLFLRAESGALSKILGNVSPNSQEEKVINAASDDIRQIPSAFFQASSIVLFPDTDTGHRWTYLTEEHMLCTVKNSNTCISFAICHPPFHLLLVR